MPRVRTLQLADAHLLEPHETAVVVDVLRATSTIAVALHRGARAVVPVLTPEAAQAAARDHDDPVLVGERARGPLEGFVDNSPATLARMDLTDRTVVLTTTNGTRALLACVGAARVIAGSLVNAGALGEHLTDEDVALVASGWMGGPAEDDDACCTYLEALLTTGGGDLEACLQALEKSTSGTKLREHGRGGDVDICLEKDRAPVVPELRDGVLRAVGR